MHNHGCPDLECCQIDHDAVNALLQTGVRGVTAAGTMPKLTADQIDMVISVVMTIKTAITSLLPNPFVSWSVGNAFDIVIQVLKLIKSKIPMIPIP